MLIERTAKGHSPKPWGLLAASLLLAPALLAACGEEEPTASDSTTTAAASADPAAGAPTTRAPEGNPRPDTGSAAPRGAGEAAVEGVEPKLGSPADVDRNRGGDNSIQDYGDEASRNERREAATVLTAYLGAYARGDGDSACALLDDRAADAVADATATLASRAPDEVSAAKDLQVESCADALGLLEAGAGSAGREAGGPPRVLSVRLDGDQAFAIYARAGDEQYAIPMQRIETDGWRIGALAGTPLG